MHLISPKLSSGDSREHPRGANPVPKLFGGPLESALECSYSAIVSLKEPLESLV
jgi:hypothetical protein